MTTDLMVALIFDAPSHTLRDSKSNSTLLRQQNITVQCCYLVLPSMKHPFLSQDHVIALIPYCKHRGIPQSDPIFKVEIRQHSMRT